MYLLSHAIMSQSASVSCYLLTWIVIVLVLVVAVVVVVAAAFMLCVNIAFVVYCMNTVFT